MTTTTSTEHENIPHPQETREIANKLIPYSNDGVRSDKIFTVEKKVIIGFAY